MKIVKYGPGMKAEKDFKIECSHCHSVFKASPFEVDFLTEDGEVSTHVTPIYKVTCPVCECSDKYTSPQKKKHRKPKIPIFLLFTILVFLDAFALIISPAAFGDDNMTVPRGIIMTILTLRLIIHLFAGALSDKFEKDENN